MICQNCEFSQPDGEAYVCMRYPPLPVLMPAKNALGQPTLSVAAIRPNVPATGWCGEYQDAGEPDTYDEIQGEIDQPSSVRVMKNKVN